LLQTFVGGGVDDVCGVFSTTPNRVLPLEEELLFRYCSKSYEIIN